MRPVVRPAAPDDLPAAAAVLARAFGDYPWTRYAVPAQDHTDRVRVLQELYLQHALDVGTVLVDESVTAVSAFLPPDAPAPDPDLRDRIVDLHGDRWPVLCSTQLPPAPDGAWTLATVGTDPQVQGGGRGTAVLVECLRRIDRAGGTVHLETSSTANVGWYERHGFRRVATTAVTPELTVVSMVRSADPGR